MLFAGSRFFVLFRKHAKGVPMAANLERAIQIATAAHEGQFRFDGSLYINHPLRVMRTVEAQGHSLFTQQTAVLHDTVEDSEWTFDMLANEGFGDEVLFALDLLTKRPGAVYDDYVARLMPNPRARAVKKADLMDNMDLTGLENPSRKRIETIEKYGRALVLLSRFPLPRV